MTSKAGIKKDFCHSRLRLLLGVLAFVGLIISVWLRVSLSRPWIPQSAMDPSTLSSRQSLYSLNGVDVGLLHGDIFNLGEHNELSKAPIALTVKYDAGEPFYPKSANSQLARRLTNNDATRESQLQRALQVLATKHRDEPIWVDTLPVDWTIDGRRIYLLAGIPAKPTTGVESVAVTAAKPGKILSLVHGLCQRARADGVERIALTFLGSGAAGVDEGKAIDSILRGINKAAADGSAPSQVTIVLYSDDKGPTPVERRSWLSGISLLFREALKDEDRFKVWEYRNTRSFLAQLVLISIVPLVAGIVATLWRRIREGIWWGPIATQSFFWAFIASGLYAIVMTSRPSLEPVSPTTLAVLMLGGFLAPLWQWGEMDKLIARERHLTSAAPDGRNRNERPRVSRRR